MLTYLAALDVIIKQQAKENIWPTNIANLQQIVKTAKCFSRIPSYKQFWIQVATVIVFGGLERVSDVMTQTRLRQTNWNRDWFWRLVFLKHLWNENFAYIPCISFRTRLCWLSLARNSVICILFLDFVRFAIHTHFLSEWVLGFVMD